MPESHISPSENERRAPRKRRGIRKRYLVLLLLLLVVAAACFPPSFRFLLRKGLEFELHRQGMTGGIGKVSGSLFQPIVLHDLRIETDAALVRRAVIAVDRVTAAFDMRGLRGKRGDRWLREVKIEGVKADLEIAGPTAPDSKTPERSSPWRISVLEWLPNLSPRSVKLANGAIVLRRDVGSLSASGIAFSFSENQPGTLRIARLEIDQPQFEREYRDLSASIGMQRSDLVLGDTTVEQNLRIGSIAIDLEALAERRVALAYDIGICGGTLRGDARSLSDDADDLKLEGTGSFASISVKRLGAFVGATSKTAGTLEEGKFTFRGSPRHPESANASLRIRATDFQWGTRQWDLLEAGGTLLNGEVRVHQLDLAQAGNRLSLSGELDLPEAGTPWWKQNFELHIAARIDDLAKLSALLGPEAEQASGKIDIDGSIRGERSDFSGQMIATGSNITYRGVPIDTLTVASRIRGNEVQVRHVELLHGDDFIRGEGVVNILGIKHYWGELKASVADLTDFAPLLVPPIAPRPFGGGLTVDWSGDGNSEAHSGAFRAKFTGLMPLEIRGNFAPLDGEIEATYSPGHIFFSTFRLGTAATDLDARVIVRPDSVEVKDLKLTHAKKPRLAGNALVPVNAWAAWAGEPFEKMVDANGKLEAELAASDVPLADALRLSGRAIPVRGDLSGKVSLSGSIAEPNATGKLSLAKGGLTFGGDTEISDLEVEAEVANDLLKISRATGKVLGGSVSATGTIRLATPEDPELALDLEAKNLALVLPGETAVKIDGAAKLTGPFSGAALAGSFAFAEFVPKEKTPFFGDLLSPIAPESGEAPLPFSIGTAPFSNWNIDLRSAQEKPVAVRRSRLRPDLHITGTLAAPRATGSLEFTDIPVRYGDRTWTAEKATAYFVADRPAPFIAISGHKDDDPFIVIGSLYDPKAPSMPEIAPVALSVAMEELPTPLSQPRIELSLPILHRETDPAWGDASADSYR